MKYETETTDFQREKSKRKMEHDFKFQQFLEKERLKGLVTPTKRRKIKKLATRNDSSILNTLIGSGVLLFMLIFLVIFLRACGA